MSADDYKLNTTNPVSEHNSPSMTTRKQQESSDAPEFGEGKLVTEADNLVGQSDTDPDALKFISDRGDMLQKINESDQSKDENKVVLNPISPLAASSTIVNLLLATGPFS
jgi:hypothetical protein